jgi:UDP-glucose 4-epimerase
MKVVVFGGSGFLGSHVSDLLTEKKIKVIIFDKYISDHVRKNFTYIKGDITDKLLVNKSLKKIDYVLNFAGLSDLNYCLDKPRETIDVDVIGNFNILEACFKNRIKKYIFASSVYVESDEGGFYKAAKLSSEVYLKEYSKYKKLNYSILRYGSLYGPRSNDKNGIYKILFNVIKNKKLYYFGDPNSRREFIHVLDAAKSTFDIMKNKDLDNKTVTITGSETILMKDLLLLISEILKINKKKISFGKKKYAGHYKITPYQKNLDYNLKYFPSTNIELSYGLLRLSSEISEEIHHQKKLNKKI